MLRIPYGIADFKKIALGKMYYVDRTSYLEVLENIGAPYISFLRPRRFGKSLWISVLQYYYGVQYKNQFQELFGSVYIGKNPTEEANSYLILRFNFSGIVSHSDEVLKTSFLNSIKSDIAYFIKSYLVPSET